MQKRDYNFNLNTSSLFACDVNIFDVVTRTILNEIGIPLEATFETVKKRVREHGQNFVVDFDKDGRVNCEDLVTLLYLGTNSVETPVRIECSDFWAWYKQNTIFKKFSTTYDVNKETFSENSILGIPLNSTRESLPYTDKDFHRCSNSQCVLFTRRCDGRPDCKDLSDEVNCPNCPDSADTCQVSGASVCLPKMDICRFNPESCKEFDVTNCQEKTWDEKLQDCCRTYGRFLQGHSNLCATSTKDLSSVKNKEDSELFESYFEFRHMSYNISICHDQVDFQLKCIYV